MYDQPRFKNLHEALEYSKATQSPYLDLGNLGLKGEELDALKEFTWLREVNFGEYFKGERTINISAGFFYDRRNMLKKLHDLPANVEGLGLCSVGFTDCGALWKYPNLKTLDLSANEQMDVSCLATLTSLTWLDLSSNELMDVSCLSTLTSLTKLYLSSNQLTDVSCLSTLTSLTKLDLSLNRLTDVTCLSTLTSLTYLDLSSNELMDVSCLATLTRLTDLDLRENQLTDVTCLSTLTSLTNLDLSLNRLTDISSLSTLTYLSLNSNQLTDVTCLSTLTRLTDLDLSLNRLTDVTCLSTLTSLVWLELSSNRLTDISLDFLACFPRLKFLSLQGNPIRNIPPAIYQGWNCLEAVRNYLQDVAAGAVRVYQSKVIVVGNGRVGKTCLLKRWLDNTYNPDEPSTHAINTRTHFAPDIAEKAKLDHVRLHVWDFGGQDIYYHTHRLFMQTQALFLVAWDAQTEAQPTQTETLPNGDTVTYQNQTVLDWLEYVRVLGRNSPAIVVETKQPDNGTACLHPQSTLIKQKGYHVKAYMAVDSANGDELSNGFERLKAEISHIIRAKIRDACVELPATWWRAQEYIHDLQARHTKTLTLAEWEAICAQCEVPERSWSTLLAYLHDTGTLFYRENLFENLLILDQQWAIDAVYVLFDRQGLFQELQKNGFFTGRQLIRGWDDANRVLKRPSYTLEEQELLASFMKSCGICIEIERYSYDTPLEKRHFLAPSLLPDEDVPNSEKIYPPHEGFWVEFEHAFLHDVVIQAFILRAFRYAKPENLRKYQILVEAEDGMAWVRACPRRQVLQIRLKSAKDKPLLDKIRSTLAEISQDMTGIVERVSIDGEGFVLMEELLRDTKNPCLLASNGKEYKRADFDIFLPQKAAAFPNPMEDLGAELREFITKGYYEEVFMRLADKCRDMEAYNTLYQEFMKFGDKDINFSKRLRLLVANVCT